MSLYPKPYVAYIAGRLLRWVSREHVKSYIQYTKLYRLYIRIRISIRGRMDERIHVARRIIRVTCCATVQISDLQHFTSCSTCTEVICLSSRGNLCDCNWSTEMKHTTKFTLQMLHTQHNLDCARWATRLGNLRCSGLSRWWVSRLQSSEKMWRCAVWYTDANVSEKHVTFIFHLLF
jgi:hypothetical protein